MRPETDNWLKDLDIIFPGEGYKGHKVLIHEEVQKAVIKHEYHRLLAARPGSSDEIKQILANRYHISVGTVEKYIYKI